MYIMSTETVGETSVSSGDRGEDGYCESAGAVHFHVASPAFTKTIQAVSVSPRGLFVSPGII